MYKHIKSIIVGLALLSVFSCKKDSRVVPDVSDIEIDVKFRHFEQDLFQIDTTNTLAELDRIQAEYPVFAEVFFENLLPVYDSLIFPEGPVKIINGFIADSMIQAMYQKSQELYKNMDGTSFEEAFRYYKYYFPNNPTPDVTSFISEYGVSNFIYDEQSLAVGLDFFLGSDWPYMAINAGNPNFSEYLNRHYKKDYLVRNTLMPLIDDLNAPMQDRKLLDYMIENGKELYVLSALMPNASDTIIHQYNQKQMQWVASNEANIYAHLIDEELLYSTNWKDFRKLIDHSPNSPGMPQDAPGRTANYIGYRIIESYMRSYPETSMEVLLNMTDAQEILAKSRYRPAQ